MTIDEAMKEILEGGINLGAGDFVSVDALKVAYDVMASYKKMRDEYEQFRRYYEEAIATNEARLREIYYALANKKIMLQIDKATAEKLGFLRRGENNDT